MCEEEKEELYNYPPKVLLANDDRIIRFLDASVYRDWNAATQEWRKEKNNNISFQKKLYYPLSSDFTSVSKPKFFSDEEFFSLTQQLEDITAAISCPSSLSLNSNTKINTNTNNSNIEKKSTLSSSIEIHDIFALDPAMYLSSLDSDQRRQCELASEEYFNGNFYKAAEEFSLVIDSCLPSMLNSALIGNRSACYLRIENYKLCLRDAIRSYEIDNNYILGIRRAVRSHFCCGRYTEAREIIEKNKNICGYKFDSELLDITLYEKYITFLNRNEHTTALKHLNKLIERVPCAAFEVLKVQLLAIEEGNQAALRYAVECLKRHKNSFELIYWNAQLRFLESVSKEELYEVLPLFNVVVTTEYTARFRQATQRIQYCIDLCQNLESLLENKDWLGLIELCSTAVQRPYIGDKLRATILARRARGYFEIKRLYECIDDIDTALLIFSSGTERSQLLLLKALAEEKLSRWSDAVKNAELSIKEYRTVEAIQIWQRLCERQKENQRRRQQEAQGNESSYYKNNKKNGIPHIKTEERKQRKTDYEKKSPAPCVVAQLYACLSLPDGVGAEKVKKSYRALAMRWHPDRWCSASDQERKEAEEKFKKVKEAYDKLMCIIGY